MWVIKIAIDLALTEAVNFKTLELKLLRRHQLGCSAIRKIDSLKYITESRIYPQPLSAAPDMHGLVHFAYASVNIPTVLLCDIPPHVSVFIVSRYQCVCIC